MKTRFTCVFLLAAAALHLVWEFVQCTPFYVAGRFPMTVANMLQVTIADVGLSVVIYGLVALVLRDVAWGTHPSRWGLIAAAVLGAVLAVGIEWHALATGRWDYSSWMPIVPGVGVGLLPVLQLVVGILVPLWVGRFVVRRFVGDSASS